uniref:hypothetical protein n=1 Tax=Pedobacter schmidteae TaxID=2201271 RepID=UPI000EB14E35|nr:hypothetical protein [Pedobacter schmidteae]
MSTKKYHTELFRVVVGHYLIAAIFFLVLALMFFFAVESLSGHYFQPRVLALTHTAALGWGTMIIFGALNQLLPVLLERELFSTRLCWWSLSFFLPGISLLVYSFWVFDPGMLMQVGGVMVLLAVALFVLNVFFTVGRKKGESVFQDFILTSCIWLMLTVVLGFIMVLNFRYAFLPKDHLHFLRLHAHMGIAGWFLLLIIGVSAKLVPMFLVSGYQKTYLLSVCYYLINGSLLLFLLDGYLHGIHSHTYLIACAGIVGILVYLIYVYKCFVSRIRKKIDLPMLQSLLSFLFLIAGIVVLPFILYYHLKNSEHAVSLSMLYGILIFMGWISALILGQTFKTLPYIIWVEHYERVTGKVKTPLPADLLNPTLLKIQFIAFVVFLGSFITGFIYSVYILKIIGTVSLVVAAVIYGVQVFLLLLHKTKTEDYDRI